MRRGENCWRGELNSADTAEWILLRACAQSIMCLISREGTQSLLLDRPSLCLCATAWPGEVRRLSVKACINRSPTSPREPTNICLASALCSDLPLPLSLSRAFLSFSRALLSLFHFPLVWRLSDVWIKPLMWLMCTDSCCHQISALEYEHRPAFGLLFKIHSKS